VLVYSIDNRDSFGEIEIWYQKLVEDCSPVPQIVLLANKTDRGEHRQIAVEEGKTLAKKLNARFFEVSAKVNPGGIKTVLEEVAIEAVERMDGGRENGRETSLREQAVGLCPC
jgi:GTPase SAR1 family protein